MCSKPVNSTPLLNDLNNVVKQEYSRGNQVILYGYSAGSLLAAAYLTQKMPVININEIKRSDDNSYIGKYFAKTIKNHKFKPNHLYFSQNMHILFIYRRCTIKC